MIIDSHQHVFWQGRDDAALVRDMDEQGIDRAWLLTFEVMPSEWRPYWTGVLNPANRRDDGTHAGIPLNDILKARDRFPERFVAGYCPHVLAGDAATLFEAAVRMHGVRVCGEWKCTVAVDDPRCIMLFRKAGELGCPVVIHLDVPFLADPKSGNPVYQDYWKGGTVANLERTMKACPETVFIGHGAGFWREISGDADGDPERYPKGPVAPGGRLDGLFERYENLYADLSGGSAETALMRDIAFSREFVMRLADRILFGRDYYGSDVHDFLGKLELPAESEEKVYSRNALRLVPVE